MNEKLLATIRYYFAQSVFMNNIHYKAYYRLDKILKRAKLFVTVISSLTLALIITNLIILETSTNSNSILKILYYVGMALTGLSLIYELFSKEDIGELKCRHRHVAEEYKILRDQFISLIEEAQSNSVSEKALRIKFQHLQDKYSQLGKSSPTTVKTDYIEAQSGLGIGENNDEEFTWSDKEIDRFLPLSLRSINKSET